MAWTNYALTGLCIALYGCGSAFVASSDAANGAGTDSGGAGGRVAGAGSGGASGGSGGTSGANDGGMGGALPASPIPALGLVLWLRADLGVLQKDGLVQQWLDQSGEKSDATQITSNVRPKYLPTGFDGKATLEFDGKDDYLNLPAGFRDFSHGLSGFIVAKPTNSDCSSMVELSNGPEIDDVALSMWQNKWQYEVKEGYFQTSIVDTSKFALYSIIHRAGGTADMRIDSEFAGSSSFALPELIVRQDTFVGRTDYASCNFFQGQLSEIILYARPVTDKEILTIEGYLQERWALPAATAP